MSKDIKETLKNNTPEFLDTYPDLVSFLEAAGSFLNETKAEIEAFDYSHDYQKSDRYALDSRLRSIGFEIPPYISEKVSRTVLRDALQAFVRKGTTDSLLWVLKIIGTTPTIRQAWLPSPKEVRDGKKINLDTGVTERYDISKYTYTDFLYGDAVVDEDGTFLRGYRYDDPFEESPLDKIPIIGENYETTPTYLTPVEKVPYVIVRISDQNFNVATEPYVDPETGEVYEYGVTEEYRAVENLIEYFLYNTTRPASVRVIVVSSIQEVSDTFGISDAIQQEWSHLPTPENDNAGFSDTELEQATHQPTLEADEINIEDGLLQDPAHDATVESDNAGFTDQDSQTLTTTVNNFYVGDPLVINFDSPFESQFQTISFDTFPINGGDYINTVWSTGGFPNIGSFPYVAYVRNGSSSKIPIRVHTGIAINAPVKNVEVYGLKHYRSNTSEGVLLDIVNTGNTKTVNVPDGYHGVFLKSEDGTDTDVNISVNYN